MVLNATFGGLQAVHLVVIVNGNIIQKVKVLTRNHGRNHDRSFKRIYKDE